VTTRKTYSLNQCPLYKLQSRKKLAVEIFRLDLQQLEQLAANPKNYRIFSIQQGTKQRVVEMPKPILERIHRRLFKLLERIEKPNYLQSGVKGRSYITNAKIHIGNVPVVKLDVKKFYPSVTYAMVFRFFHDQLQCSPDVSGLLTKLVTCNGHVPTGSCLSQLLAFFSTKPMFDNIDSLAKNKAICFSCYVDDMTFSGANATPELLWTVKQAIHAFGLEYHKEHCYSAQQKKLVTGVMVSTNGIGILPSKEHEVWLRINDLGTGDPVQRKIAITSLIGTCTAMGQIEARLLRRVKRLRQIQSRL
jgi:Reverse transcriptase (RNA-dependent DNA polymerase)